MAFGDSDLPALFADFGEPAVINGQAVTVLPETPLTPWEHSGVGSIEQSCTRISAPITAFTSLPVAGQAVTFRGSSWTIKGRSAPGDGRILELELKAAS